MICERCGKQVENLVHTEAYENGKFADSKNICLECVKELKEHEKKHPQYHYELDKEYVVFT